MVDEEDPIAPYGQLQSSERLGGAEPLALCSIYLSVDESTVAETLSRVDAGAKQVKIGSYPRMGDNDHRVRVTLEAADAKLAEQTLDRLLELLDDAWVVRVDRGG